MYHYYQFNESKAVRHYELTLYFDPTCDYAFSQLVELLMDKKRYEEVKAQLTKVENAGHLEKDFIYETLGHVAEKLADYRGAIGYYRKAYPNFVLGIVMRSKIAIKQGFLSEKHSTATVTG